MIRPTTYLRTASVLVFIHGVLHTVGGVFGKPMPGAATVAFTAMQANHFPVMGLDRTYAQFYLGLGLGLSIALFVDAALLWLLASLIRIDGARLRPILAVFLVEYVAIAVNSSLFFFWAPVVFELIIALCVGLAMAGARRGDPLPVA